jgi:hypothetical protein
MSKQPPKVIEEVDVKRLRAVKNIAKMTVDEVAEAYGYPTWYISRLLVRQRKEVTAHG